MFKTILLTGGTGFLGKAIVDYTKRYMPGSDIRTLGRHNADVICDLSLAVPALPYYDLIIHAAGKAHSVPRTQAEKDEFFAVNVKGTLQLLEGLEKSDLLPKAFCLISSVAVYGLESGIMIKEDQTLAAKDPYGLSKIEAESIVEAWCKKNNVTCLIIRLPLIAGTNPPGNLKAMINGIRKGYYFDINGGKARKSIVMASDVARVIPIAAEIGGIYHLTDSIHPRFSDLSTLIAKQSGKSKVLNMPMWLATIIAKVGDLLGKSAPLNSNKLTKIISDLTFDDESARKNLKWEPTPVLDGFKIQ